MYMDSIVEYLEEFVKEGKGILSIIFVKFFFDFFLINENFRSILNFFMLVDVMKCYVI